MTSSIQRGGHTPGTDRPSTPAPDRQEPSKTSSTAKPEGRLAADHAIHQALQTQPERRDAVYTRLARTEPALIHHLESWRQQDDAAALVQRADFPVAPANDRSEPLLDRVGPAPSLNVRPVEAGPRQPGTEMPAAVSALPLATTGQATESTRWAAVSGLLDRAAPMAKTLLVDAMARGAQALDHISNQATQFMAQAVAKTQATNAQNAAIDEATAAVQAQSSPERRASELNQQIKLIEELYGRDAAVELVARVVEADPADFAEGVTRASYGYGAQSAGAHTQGILAQGVSRAYERAAGGSAGSEAMAAELVAGMQRGQMGFPLTQMSALVGSSGNDELQVDFVEAGLDLAAQLAAELPGGYGFRHAMDLVASLGVATRNSPEAAQAVIDKSLQLPRGADQDSLLPAGPEALNWVLNQFRNGAVPDANGEYLDGYSIFMNAAVPADAPAYPGAPFTLPSTPLSSEQSSTLFLAIAGDDNLLKAALPTTSRLFEQYAADWIDDPALVGARTGLINEQFDPALSNFYAEALFNPDTDGAYRQQLMGSVVSLMGELSSGTVGADKSAEARGRTAGGMLSLIHQGFELHADEIRADGARSQAWADFLVGVGFSMIPGPGGKIAGILVGMGTGQSRAVVQSTIEELIQAGVSADIARAAAEAANRGELLQAFEATGISPEGLQHVAEYFDLQQGSLDSGSKTLGELFLDILTDGVVSPDPDFADGVKLGWDALQAR